MTDTSTPSDQDIDAEVAALSPWGRRWLLTVAGLSVLLVISSMIALNTALPDIAVETAASQAQPSYRASSARRMLLPPLTCGTRRPGPGPQDPPCPATP